jgi:hypothetical protein
METMWFHGDQMSTDGDELWFQTIPKVGYTQIMVAISLKIQSSWATYLFLLPQMRKSYQQDGAPPVICWFIIPLPIVLSTINHRIQPLFFRQPWIGFMYGSGLAAWSTFGSLNVGQIHHDSISLDGAKPIAAAGVYLGPCGQQLGGMVRYLQLL